MAKDDDEIRLYEIWIILDRWESIRIGSQYREDYKKIWIPFLTKIKKFHLKKVRGKVVEIDPVDEREFQQIISHFSKRYGIAEPICPAVCSFNRNNEMNEQNTRLICRAFVGKQTLEYVDHLSVGGVLFKKLRKEKVRNVEFFSIGRVTAQDIRKLKSLSIRLDESVGKERLSFHYRNFVKQWRKLINRQNELGRAEKTRARNVIKKHQIEMRKFLQNHKREVRYQFKENARRRQVYRFVERFKRREICNSEAPMVSVTTYLNPGLGSTLTQKEWDKKFNDITRDYRDGRQLIQGVCLK